MDDGGHPSSLHLSTQPLFDGLFIFLCVVKSEGRSRQHTGSLLTHFICLALSLLPMKRLEKHCIIKLHARRTHHPPATGGSEFLPVFPRLHAQKHPGGVASMTRDRGYPDWLVLSALLRLLWAG